MTQKDVVIAICFAIAAACALGMLPLSSQLVSTPAPDMAGEAYNGKWILACVLGIVGLVSALTGKRLSQR